MLAITAPVALAQGSTASRLRADSFGLGSAPISVPVPAAFLRLFGTARALALGTFDRHDSLLCFHATNLFQFSPRGALLFLLPEARHVIQAVDAPGFVLHHLLGEANVAAFFARNAEGRPRRIRNHHRDRCAHACHLCASLAPGRNGITQASQALAELRYRDRDWQ